MGKLTHAFMPKSVLWLLFFTLFVVSLPALARNLEHNPSQTQRMEPTINFCVNDVLGNHSSQSVVGPLTGDGAQHGSSKPIGPFYPKGGVPVSDTTVRRTDPSSGWWSFLTSSQALEPGLLTEVDEELRGGGMLGPQLQGKLQGVFVTRSENNGSLIVALKAAFTGSESDDSLRFFGLHHPSLPESHIAVVGGTGKYHEANGYAVVKASNTEAHGDGDEIKKILSFTVYLK